MIFKILIIAAVLFYIRLIFKKANEATKRPLPKKKPSKDDSIEAEYEVID